MSLRNIVEWKILNVWDAIDRFIRVRLLRGCERKCPMCAIDIVTEWHYNLCENCKKDDLYSCKTFEVLMDVQNAIYDKWVKDDAVDVIDH